MNRVLRRGRIRIPLNPGARFLGKPIKEPVKADLLNNKIIPQFWRDFCRTPNAPRIWRAKTALDLAPPSTLRGESRV